MQLLVNGRNMDVGAALRQYIDDSLRAVLDKYFGDATDAQVTLSKTASGFEADIQIHINRRVMVRAHGRAGGAYGAFEEARDHAAKRLRRHKRRLRDDKAAPDAPVLTGQHYVLRPDEADAPNDGPAKGGGAADAPMIVAEMSAEIETLSVSAAVMRMDLANQPAMMFRSASHGGLNMVYRREDGNIGWVDPGAPAA